MAANVFFRPWPHLIYGFFGPPDSAPQAASRSVQPFCQGSRTWITKRQTDSHWHTDWPLVRYSVYSNGPLSLANKTCCGAAKNSVVFLFTVVHYWCYFWITYYLQCTEIATSSGCTHGANYSFTVVLVLQSSPVVTALPGGVRSCEFRSACFCVVSICKSLSVFAFVNWAPGGRSLLSSIAFLPCLDMHRTTTTTTNVKIRVTPSQKVAGAPYRN